jgi:hypothetical protein
MSTPRESLAADDFRLSSAFVDVVVPAAIREHGDVFRNEIHCADGRTIVVGQALQNGHLLHGCWALTVRDESAPSPWMSP